MVSDSISNPSVTASAGNARDLAKKKRTNRSAKLKQCKLDARREQWLSQVKNKGTKDEGNGGDREPLMRARNEGNRSLENLEMSNQDSDWDSPSNSPTSGSSVLGGNDSGTNYTGSSSNSSRSSSSSSNSSRSSSSSSGGCCSGSITEEEEDDGCLDDWETVADAIAAGDKQQNSANLPPVNASVAQSDSPHGLSNQTSLGGQEKQECVRVPKAQANARAWRPDDAFRPQSLPNLTKQHSFPMNSDRHYGRGGAIAWTCKSSVTVPSACPICCEDLDMTDTSFLPCPCGFRLCLFCHKRILEEDGRCPGCRKTYKQEAVEGEASVNGGNLTFWLARSCSMITRNTLKSFEIKWLEFCKSIKANFQGQNFAGITISQRLRHAFFHLVIMRSRRRLVMEVVSSFHCFIHENELGRLSYVGVLQMYLVEGEKMCNWLALVPCKSKEVEFSSHSDCQLLSEHEMDQFFFIGTKWELLAISHETMILVFLNCNLMLC